MQNSINSAVRQMWQFLIALSFLAAAPIAHAQPANPLAGNGDQPAAQQAPAAPPAAQAPVAGGAAKMQFKKFVITDDPAYTGMEVTHGLIPADWTITGGPVWNLSDGRPMQMRIHICDPQDVEAFDVYPNHFFYFNRKMASAQIPRDYKYMGSIVERAPNSVLKVFRQVVIGRDRPDLANAQVVREEKMPEVTRAATASMGQNPKYVKLAAAEKITLEYDLNGQTVDEQFFLTYEQAVNPRLGFMGWQVMNVSSMRAPKGQLAQLDVLRDMVVRSCRPNLAFYTKVTNFVLDREKVVLHQLQIQGQQIEARQQEQQREDQERQILQNARSDANDEEKSSFDQHMADLDRQSDAEADVQREVSPWKDSDGSTYKLPTKYGNAWSSADGRIIMNNDPQYNPNSDPSLTPTQWTAMEQAGN